MKEKAKRPSEINISNACDVASKILRETEMDPSTIPSTSRTN